MDPLDVDRIRRVTFPMSRKGYSQRAVHDFLDRLAAWLESGEGDPARADLLRRDLRRIGERTATILAEAEAAAERTRAAAEREAARIIQSARDDAAMIRGGPGAALDSAGNGRDAPGDKLPTRARDRTRGRTRTTP